MTADLRFELLDFFVADFTDVIGHDFDTDLIRDDLAAQALGAQRTNSRFRIVVMTSDGRIEAFTEKMRAMYRSDGPEIYEFETMEQAEA